MIPVHLDDERAQRLVDGLLPQGEAAAARQHAAACADCRLLVESYQALCQALDGLTAPPVAGDFTGEVMARIDERERVAAGERRTAFAILGVAAGVAVLLLAVAGQAAWAPVLARAGETLGSLVTSLRLASGVASTVVRALRLEILVASAGAAIPILVGLRRLTPRHAEARA